MKNFAKKVMMVLTCFIIFTTNVNVVGVIKNIDVSGLFRKVEDESSTVEAADQKTLGIDIVLFQRAGTKDQYGNVASHDWVRKVRNSFGYI